MKDRVDAYMPCVYFNGDWDIRWMQEFTDHLSDKLELLMEGIRGRLLQSAMRGKPTSLANNSLAHALDEVVWRAGTRLFAKVCSMMG